VIALHPEHEGGMQRIRTLSSRILAVVWAAVLAFLILGVAQIWNILLVINLSTSAAIPWAVPLMALVLWLLWQYLSGRGWPRRTAETRHRLLRANPVSGRVFAWALVTGVLAIVALAGYWIIMFNLFKMAGNVLPDVSRVPLLTVVLILAMSVLVSPLCEEAGFRGYGQSILERTFRGPALPVLISSVLFGLAHLTQGFYVPKLFVYFLAGLLIGGIAYVTQSILPGIAVHILADLTFFTLVWPYDTQRPLIWEVGASYTWFWVHLAQALVFTVLAILAFRRLVRITRDTSKAAAAVGGQPFLPATDVRPGA
jgi:membrane protease YdiL (CAAX protease family)